MPRRRRDSVAFTVVVTVLVMLGALVMALVVALSGAPGTLALAALLAALPVGPLVGCFMWLDRYEPEPRSLLVGGLLWGAFVATAARVLPRRLGGQLGAVARTFSSGFAVAREPRALTMAFLWSLPLWLLLAAEAWFVTRAFSIAMPFTGSFLLQALLVIGVAVPTPGAVGSYHEAYRIGVTTFFGAPNDAAVAAAIVVHAVGFIPVVFVGLLFMAQDGLSVRRLQALTTTARAEEMPDTNEMPVLRTSRR